MRPPDIDQDHLPTRVHLPNPRLLKAAWEDSTLKHVKRSDLLVLLALIQHTNKNGDTVWPSIERLAKYTRFSKRQVIRILERLEDKQVIERERRGRGRVYRMAPALRSAAVRTGDMYVTNAETIGDTDVTSKVTPVSSIGDKDVTLSIKEDSQRSIHAQDGLEGWAEFWEAYPRKAAKKDALAAFRQTRRVRPPLVNLLAAVKFFARGDEWQREGGRFVPYPATWLRKERWRDVPAGAELEAAAADPTPAPPPEDWQRLVRVYVVNFYPDNDEEPPTSWRAVPDWMRREIKTLVEEEARLTDTPEGWADAIAALREAGDLTEGDVFETWPAVPAWLRVHVRLLLQKSEQTETRRDAA
jgi:predicted transcriptional regulator